MAAIDEQITYEFDRFRLIPGEGLLLREGQPVPMAPKAFETLLFLIERRGHLVQKSELMEQVWADAFVEENAVSKCVWSIRNALGEEPKSARFIQTVPKRGYRFVADVREPAADVNGSAAADDGSGPISAVPEHAVVPNRSPALRYGVIALAGIILVVSALAFRSWLPAGGESAAVRSLTVLPFENVSGDLAQDYFVDGITDALIAHLSRIKALQIIALPANLRSKDQPRDVSELGRQVQVDGLLTGSVSRSGERVRVAVQLVHAQTGRSLWGKVYERDQRDIQALEMEVARNITDEIKITVTPQERERLGSIRGAEPLAYDSYIRGRYFLNRQNPKDQDIGIAALERAVEIDASFAAAHAELAQAYTWKMFAFAPNESGLAEKAFIATEKALSLDPNAATAYLARGRLLWTPGNHFPHEKAIKDYRRALELNPNLDEARNQLALVYCHVGLLDEALQEAREGVRINPTNNLLLLRIGQTLNSQSRYDEALAVLRSIPNEVHPSVVGHQTAWALFNLGRMDEAGAKVEQLLRNHPDSGGTFASMQAVIAAAAGQHARSEELILQAIEKGKGFGHFHHTAYTIAGAYSLMGRTDEALRYLELAAETGFPCYPSFERDSNFENLRSHPRFGEFLANQKQRWEGYKSLL